MPGNPPIFTTTAFRWYQRLACQFGGLPVPVFATTMPWVDLNDVANWRLIAPPKIDNTHISNKASQIAWRGKGIWLAQDFIGRKVYLPAWYDETGGTPFTQAKAQLTQAGEQYLTFDGGVTGIRVKMNSFAETDMVTGFPDDQAGKQFAFKGQLEFMSRNPYAEDIAATSFGPLTALTSTTVPNTGASNSFNIPYLGHVYGEPVYTLSVPNSNTAPITEVQLQNTASGESLSCTFATPLAAGVAHTIVIDVGLSTVTADTVAQNFSGSFPFLYGNPAHFATPPVAENNSFILRIIVSSGTIDAAASFSASYRCKWEF
jgi:hypothetical protein